MSVSNKKKVLIQIEEIIDMKCTLPLWRERGVTFVMATMTLLSGKPHVSNHLEAEKKTLVNIGSGGY